MDERGHVMDYLLVIVLGYQILIFIITEKENGGLVRNWTKNIFKPACVS